MSINRESEELACNAPTEGEDPTSDRPSSLSKALCRLSQEDADATRVHPSGKKMPGSEQSPRTPHDRRDSASSTLPWAASQSDRWPVRSAPRGSVPRPSA